LAAVDGMRFAGDGSRVALKAVPHAIATMMGGRRV
jgi:hypothetical protein